MLFVFHALDKDDAHPRRMANYDAHKTFVADHAKWGVQIVMSGPLVADDGTTPIGSCFIIEAPDRATAEAFHKDDPFLAAGLWDKPSLTAFIKRHG